MSIAMRTAATATGNTRIAAYLTSQAVTYVGDNFYGFALPWILLGSGYGASTAALTLAVVAALAAILYRAAGAAITRSGPLRVQLWGQAAMVVTLAAGSVVLLRWPSSLLTAGLVALIWAAVTQFARPAATTLLVSLTADHNRLRRANTVLEYGQAIAGIAIPVVAGVLVTAGLAPALLLSLAAVSSLPLTVLLAAWATRSTGPKVESGPTLASPAPSTTKDTGAATGSPAAAPVRPLLTVGALINFAISAFFVLIPIIFVRHGALSVGTGFAAFAAGFLAGGLLIKALRRLSDAATCAIGLIIVAAGDLILAAFGGTAMGLIGLSVSGIGMLPTRVAYRTLTQTIVPISRLGHVASAQMALGLAARPVSLAFSAIIIAAANARLAVSLFAAALVGAAILVNAALRPTAPTIDSRASHREPSLPSSAAA
jgi:MFS transporter